MYIYFTHLVSEIILIDHNSEHPLFLSIGLVWRCVRGTWVCTCTCPWAARMTSQPIRSSWGGGLELASREQPSVVRFAPSVGHF